MGEYLRPDVYVEDKASGNMAIEGVSTSIGGFIGVTPRGKVGVPTLVSSWSDFCLKFARGLDTPFMADSDLAYAVYGFFLNGGTTCYVDRIAVGATKASIVVPEASGVKFTALDEGTWANEKLVIDITTNTKEGANFDITIKFDNVVVEKYTNLSANKEDENFYANAINDVSNFVTVADTGTLAVGKGTMKSGTNHTSLLEADYVKALNDFDTVSNVNLLAIPGQSSTVVLKGILDYCANRGDVFPILDPPKDTDSTEAIALTDEIAGVGAMYGPYGYVTDPLSTQGKLRLVPPSGHVMGVYARTDKERGVHKSPAGQDAVVRGFVSLERAFTNSELEVLNPVGFNAIVSRPNMGIVIWGARTLSPNAKKKYISDVRLDIKIKVSCKAGTQWAVFEPNDNDLWNRVEGSLSAFMRTLWLEGALLGETPEQAYYVKCDAETNPTETQDVGRVVAEVGYATKKPGEFIIVRFSQNSVSSAQ